MREWKLAGVRISQGDTVSAFVPADRGVTVSGDASSANAVQPVATSQDLLRQIDSARQTLEAQLNTLRAADTMHLHQDLASNASANLQRLNLLSLQLAGGAKDVTALRADIASALADIRAYTSDMRSAVSAAQSGTGTTAQLALYEANASAQRSVSDFTRDYYEKHIFDRYLKFASPEDEEAYRQREEARRKAIETARAENTPEGNLRAVNLSIDQLKDAGTHGADRSPDYKPAMERLQKNNDALTQAIEHQSQPTRATQTANATPSDIDPLQSVGAKAPSAKGAAAILLAAGISQPQPDNVGHGVNDRTGQSNSQVRGG